MEDNKKFLGFLPDGWNSEEKVMAAWFIASIILMLFFMVVSMLPGFIGGFSVVISIIALISAIISVACLMYYELNKKSFD